MQLLFSARLKFSFHICFIHLSLSKFSIWIFCTSRNDGEREREAVRRGRDVKWCTSSLPSWVVPARFTRSVYRGQWPFTRPCESPGRLARQRRHGVRLVSVENNRPRPADQRLLLLHRWRVVDPVHAWRPRRDRERTALSWYKNDVLYLTLFRDVIFRLIITFNCHKIET